MAINQKELYLTHSLDIAWIIALWHHIHGGDPAPNEQFAETTDLIARGLVGHLNAGKAEAPKDAIEKLAKLGMKVTMKENDQHTEIKSTQDFHAASGKVHGIPVFCISLADGSQFCWLGRFIPPFLTKA
jgi:hypothetical protein